MGSWNRWAAWLAAELLLLLFMVGCGDDDECVGEACAAAVALLEGACDVETVACPAGSADNGGECDDGDACTIGDRYVAGTCTAEAAVVCSAGGCHEAGSCDPETGQCSRPAKADGTGCDDENACTEHDRCLAGTCTGSLSGCAAETGACAKSSAANGTACDDGDACTVGDRCAAGECIAGHSVTCPALDQCHSVGVCDRQTGACSQPLRAERAGCDDGDACTHTDTCQAGVCAGVPFDAALGGTADCSGECLATGEPGAALVCAPSSAVSVVAGADHTCALLMDGRVKCWGRNQSGQLGLGDTHARGGPPLQMGDALSFVDLGSSGQRATQLAAGRNHTCALLTDGQVKCWGDNYGGQLGLGDTGSRGDQPGEMGDALPRIDLGKSGERVVQLAAGWLNTCALLESGRIKCWGYGGSGQLGAGDTNSRGDGPNEMGDAVPYVDLGSSGLHATQLAGGEVHMCALLDGGQIKCWGYNGDGQLGLGDTNWRGDGSDEMGDALASVDLGSTAAPAIRVVAGERHTCALLEAGQVKCWGYAASGQIGLGDTISRGDDPGEMGDALPAVELGAAGGGATQLTAGWSHTCALLASGDVKCWGYDIYGQLGLGGRSTRGDGPSEMGEALPVIDWGTATPRPTQLDAGASHTCALTEDGQIKCWGNAAYGQLGLGEEKSRGDTPGELADALPSVALGGARASCNGSWVDRDGDELQDCVDACPADAGNDADGDGVCGDIDNCPLSANRAQSNGDGVGPGDACSFVSISAGERHTCALLADGRVKCWGYGLYGQLGIGSSSMRGDGPEEMGDALPFVDLGSSGELAAEIAVGSSHVCALLVDGRVKCWGSNDDGQLGLGDIDPRGVQPGEMGDDLPFVDLGASGERVTQLSAGRAHTCALLESGRVKCWGDNFAGQLGLGAATRQGDAPGEMGDALPFVDLGASGERVSQLVAGQYLTCALFENGRAKCWGTGLYGPLGLGDGFARGTRPNQMGDFLPFIDFAGEPIVRLAAGGFHVCAAFSNGRAKCWGDNNSGALGLGDTSARGDEPNEMADALPFVDLGSDGERVTQLTVGYNHACALLESARAKCWGDAYSGQLGLGDRNGRGDEPNEMGDALPFVDLGAPAPRVRQLSAGDEHTCALFEDERIKCWGSGAYGQLGLGDTSSHGGRSNQMGEALRAVDLGLVGP